MAEREVVQLLGFCDECWTECNPWTCPCHCHPLSRLVLERTARTHNALLDLEREVRQWRYVRDILMPSLDKIDKARTEPIALAT